MIIDTDSHICEPPDLWTARLPHRWADQAPRVVHDERTGTDRWLIGGRKLTGVAGFAVAGWHEHPPKFPPRLADAQLAAFDPKARLALMDEYGIYAQSLYPNLLAFMSYAFRSVADDFALVCIRAYNDYLIDFAAEGGQPDRFISLCALPFWDLDASIAELDRAHEIGHRGVLFIGKPHKLGLPHIGDEHWAPLFRDVEERGLSLNFHTSFSEMTEEEFLGVFKRGVTRAEYAKTTVVTQLGVSETLADLVTSEFCTRYPTLATVMIESGVGWIRYLLEGLDWQWVNSGAQKANPERELPSFYFERQVYGSFWYERESMARIADLYPNNFMFGTDYPHPTSLSPGPISNSLTPPEMLDAALAGIDEDIQRKIRHETATRLYHVAGTNDRPAESAA